MISQLVIAELRNQIERNASLLEATEDRMAHAPKNALGYLNRGNMWFQSGVNYVLLEDYQSTEHAFTKAAEQYAGRAFIDDPPHLPSQNNALESAILGSNLTLARQLAEYRIVPGQYSSLLYDRLIYARALPALVLRDNRRAVGYVENAIAVDPKKAWYPKLVEAIRALCEEDADRFESALSTILNKHNRYAHAKRSQYYQSPRGYICVPATILAAFAMRQSIKVPFNLPGRHSTLSFPILATEEFEGSSVRGKDIKISVDYIPAPLISSIAAKIESNL